MFLFSLVTVIVGGLAAIGSVLAGYMLARRAAQLDVQMAIHNIQPVIAVENRLLGSMGDRTDHAVDQAEPWAYGSLLVCALISPPLALFAVGCGFLGTVVYQSVETAYDRGLISYRTAVGLHEIGLRLVAFVTAFLTRQATENSSPRCVNGIIRIHP